MIDGVQIKTLKKLPDSFRTDTYTELARMIGKGLAILLFIEQRPDSRRRGLGSYNHV